jgi:hypothetical protein
MVRWFGRASSSLWLSGLLAGSFALASGDSRILLAWLALVMPLSIAAWAALQRGFSGRAVLVASLGILVVADVAAMVLNQDACCLAAFVAPVHGAISVLAARLTERMESHRRARFFASVRRGLALFRDLRRSQTGPYR